MLIVICLREYMESKSCPNCFKKISRSWYVFSGLGETYRCVNCSTLIEWSDNAYFFRVAQFILFVILMYLILSLTEINIIAFLLAVSLTDVISNFIPSKWFVRISSK